MIHTSDYRGLVRRSISVADGSPIMNGSPDHARVLYSEIFGNARRFVRVLSSRLTPDCWFDRDVISAARHFAADSGHELHVLIEKHRYDDSNAIESDEFVRAVGYDALGKRRDNVQFKSVKAGDTEQYTFNMTLMDEAPSGTNSESERFGYRFERDREERVAVAAWGDVQLMRQLEKWYAYLWERGVDITRTEELTSTSISTA